MKKDNEQDLANRVLDRCGSTNDIAKKLSESGFSHGTWVSAQIQEAGRGRLGRKWESQEGNLFLSLIVRIENKSLWSWIPLTVAIAIIRYLRTTFEKSEFQVKWPNDLWYSGAKLGGILCEGSGLKSTPSIIVGIGLNCLHAPTGLDQNTVSLSSILQRPIAADEIRLPLIQSILKELEELTPQGLDSIRKSYELWSAFPSGSLVEWSDSEQVGRIQGLGPSGELIVCNENQNEKLISLFAEDIRPGKRKEASKVRKTLRLP